MALLVFSLTSAALTSNAIFSGRLGNIMNVEDAAATSGGGDEQDTGEQDTGEQDTGEQDTGEQDTGEQDTGEAVPPPGSDIIIAPPPGGGELPPTPELTPLPTGPQGFAAPTPALTPAPGLLPPTPALTPTPGLIQSLVPGATCVLGPPAAGLPSCPQTAFSLTQKCVTIPFIGRVCVPFPGGDDSPPTPTPTKTPSPLRCPPFCFTPLPTGVLEETPPTTPPVTPPTTPPVTPPTTPPVTPPTIITNTNNLQTIQTVSNFAGAITTTPDCPPQSATVLLGPSTMENGGARILAAFEPCILTDGSVVLNLPDEQGIQLVAANIQAGQTTQSAVVPMQRIAPITEGQTLYTVDLNEQITGADPATGAQVTLNGNINALFLLNLGGQEVEFSGDNSVALNAILRR
jgi:hypothetical protein